MPDPKFVKPWHGIPREQIEWHPSVDEDACIGCILTAYFIMWHDETKQKLSPFLHLFLDISESGAIWLPEKVRITPRTAVNAFCKSMEVNLTRLLIQRQAFFDSFYGSKLNVDVFIG
ncbi:MAG: hypothetical protein WA941_20290 [Nitrososphaeraceae archaeon]